MKLSYTQRFALIHAYAPDYSVEIRPAPDEDGFAPQTLRSLHGKGLIEMDGHDGYEWAEVTDVGREALGLRTLQPTDLEDAVRQAVQLILETEVEEYYAHQDVPAVCVDEDEWNDRFVWTDTTEVLAAVRIPGMTSAAPFEADPDVLLSAVGRAITELGYPVVTERYRTLVYFSRSEELD